MSRMARLAERRGLEPSVCSTGIYTTDLPATGSTTPPRRPSTTIPGRGATRAARARARSATRAHPLVHLEWLLRVQTGRSNAAGQVFERPRRSVVAHSLEGRAQASTHLLCRFSPLLVAVKPSLGRIGQRHQAQRGRARMTETHRGQYSKPSMVSTIDTGQTSAPQPWQTAFNKGLCATYSASFSLTGLRLRRGVGGRPSACAP